MKYTGTLRTPQPSSSEVDHEAKTVTVRLAMPKSWGEMTQAQLRYVLGMLATTGDPDIVKAYAVIRFTGMEVISKTREGWKLAIEADGRKRPLFLHDWEMAEYTRQLDYIDTYEGMDCRLDAVCGLTAVDVPLTMLTLGEYLNAEKYYQGFFINGRKDSSLLQDLGYWLYVDDKGRHAGDDGCAVGKWAMDEGERLGAFLWFSYAKSLMAAQFPHFLHRGAAQPDGTRQFPDILRQYNVQVRALTDGDVTKEEEVLKTPCWRALTELDAKAREAEELERIRMKGKA